MMRAGPRGEHALARSGGGSGGGLVVVVALLVVVVALALAVQCLVRRAAVSPGYARAVSHTPDRLIEQIETVDQADTAPN
jgi:hypothetical protein